MDPSSAAALQTVVKESLASLTTQSTPKAPTIHHGSTTTALGSGPQSKWMLPSQVSADDKAVLDAIQQILTCRTMAEHGKAFANAAGDIYWDAPPVLLQGRESMRVMVYAAKRIATLDYEPLLVKREEVSSTQRKLHVEVMVRVYPLRPFWPLTWVLPAAIPIRATIVVGVYRSPSEPIGSWGVINYLWGRWHNYPIFPDILRSLTGLVMGHSLKWTEQLWTPGLPLIGDSSVQDAETGPAAHRPY